MCRQSTDNRPMLSGNRPMTIRTITIGSITRLRGKCITGETHV
jgi:hypothetical protein